jgi:hypothetical protein
LKPQHRHSRAIREIAEASTGLRIAMLLDKEDVT